MAMSPIGVLRRATNGALGVEYALPIEKPIPSAAAGVGYGQAHWARIGRRCVHFAADSAGWLITMSRLLRSDPYALRIVLEKAFVECPCGILVHSVKRDSERHVAPH